MLTLPVTLESQIVDLANKSGQSVDLFLAKLIKNTKTDVFEVIVSVHEGIWTAECDQLGLVTEADSYDELVERACLIAPELAELNHLAVDADKLSLAFFHEQSVQALAG
jgi:hypothetical protein